MELGELLRADLARSVGAVLEADQHLGDAVTVEALHDARVGLRRARSQLRTFRSVFEPDWVSACRREIGWYLGLLGEVRNIDVAAERVLVAPEHPRDARAVAALTTLFAVDRADALRHLGSGRDSRRYAEVLRILGELGSAPPMRKRAGRDARDVLPAMLDRPWRDLREATRAARCRPAEDRLHHVRIRAKELRYSSELAVPVLGSSAKELARAASEVQRRLGDQRDAMSAAAWLREAAERAPECGFLAGKLARGQQMNAGELAKGWPKQIRQVERASRQLRRASRG